MPILTIRGQLGSGAPETGRQVANRLGVDYVDREIIAEVAERLHSEEEDIIEKEMPPGSLLGRVAKALSRSYIYSGGIDGIYLPVHLPTWEMPLDDERYLEALETVIKELASSQSIVIHGRGSQFFLKGYHGAFHVLVVAPVDLRVKRVMEDLKVDEETAKKEMAHYDNSRHEFTRRYFHAELEDPAHYDLVVNTQHLSFEAAASIIVGALPLKAGS